LTRALASLQNVPGDAGVLLTTPPAQILQTGSFESEIARLDEVTGDPARSRLSDTSPGGQRNFVQAVQAVHHITVPRPKIHDALRERVGECLVIDADDLNRRACRIRQ